MPSATPDATAPMLAAAPTAALVCNPTRPNVESIIPADTSVVPAAKYPTSLAYPCTSNSWPATSFTVSASTRMYGPINPGFGTPDNPGFGTPDAPGTPSGGAYTAEGGAAITRLAGRITNAQVSPAMAIFIPILR